MKNLYILIFSFLTFTAFGQAPAGYYESANGSGFNLKNQLHDIIDEENDGNSQPNHDITKTYGELWNLYETSDKRSDGTVWDMYSDCDFMFDVDQDRGTGGNVECDVFNREHSFPRSWFGGNSDLAIFSDAFHVIPTDKKVNAERGNLAFGEVSTANYTSRNGSKVGPSSLTGPTGSVFEPIDEFKGDIARGYFYIATRYQDQIAAWEANDTDGDSMLDGSSDKVFELWALDMLYDWHINDPVSQKEIDRNNAIFMHQNNRNPFIDNPQFVQQIWQNTLNTRDFTATPQFKIYPNPVTTDIIYVTTNTNTTVRIYDVLGKMVAKHKVSSTDNDINISALRDGVYLVKLNSHNGSTTRKLIVR